MQPATQWDDLHRLEHAVLAPGLLQLVGDALEQAA
jgi:hypothetical protein